MPRREREAWSAVQCRISILSCRLLWRGRQFYTRAWRQATKVSCCMGNPSISTQLHNGTATERRIDPHNGILAYIGATFIVEGSRQFPPAGQDQQANPERQAVVDVPDLGPVMITYRLNNYRHRRSSRWHWLAVRADAVRTDPAPLAAPPAE